MRTGLRLARAATDPEEARPLARDATQATATVGAVARAVSAGTPLPQALGDAGEALAELSAARHPRAPPRQRARRSPRRPAAPPRDDRPTTTARPACASGARPCSSAPATSGTTSTRHPAYERILGELAPDEARVLLLLLEKGPQPSVDVRTGGPIGHGRTAS